MIRTAIINSSRSTYTIPGVRPKELLPTMEARHQATGSRLIRLLIIIRLLLLDLLPLHKATDNILTLQVREEMLEYEGFCLEKIKPLLFLTRILLLGIFGARSFVNLRFNSLCLGL
jgi:hypothetical protein